MKPSSLFNRTRPRPFTYTPLFDKTEDRPISSKLKRQEDNKFHFERKVKSPSFLSLSVFRMLIPAAILAAIVYFCLIIVGK